MESKMSAGEKKNKRTWEGLGKVGLILWMRMSVFLLAYITFILLWLDIHIDLREIFERSDTINALTGKSWGRHDRHIFLQRTPAKSVHGLSQYLVMVMLFNLFHSHSFRSSVPHSPVAYVCCYSLESFLKRHFGQAFVASDMVEPGQLSSFHCPYQVFLWAYTCLYKLMFMALWTNLFVLVTFLSKMCISCFGMPVFFL